jgi:magnesium transporter
MRPIGGRLVTMRGTFVIPDEATGAATVVADPDNGAVTAKLADGTPFWLDLDSLDGEAFQLLGAPFEFHPLAIEDAEHFGQRPKIDVYDTFTLIVAYGVTDDGGPVEVHCFYAEHFLVTVHRGDVPNLAAAMAHLADHATPLPAPIMLLHRVVDTLVDSYLPALDAMDSSIDALEDAILRRPTEAQLGDLFRLKRVLGTVRRLLSGQRDVFASVRSGDEELPGMTLAAERYFRDVYDHLVRASQAVDSLRDLLISAVDAHLSTTSNRLNVVMKQLTIIATVFLPLSFVTGFFGQNFAWMVDHVTSAWAFWVGGVAIQVLVVIALVAMFRREGWTGRGADE